MRTVRSEENAPQFSSSPFCEALAVQTASFSVAVLRLWKTSPGSHLPGGERISYRALFSVSCSHPYTCSRIGAAVSLKVQDYFQNGKRSVIRLRTKGGKEKEFPVHHQLEEILDSYLDVSGLRANPTGPLFPTTLIVHQQTTKSYSRASRHEGAPRSAAPRMGRSSG